MRRKHLPRRDGDRLLFCGRQDAYASMRWTLQNTHALTYVLYGSSPPRGLVWRWMTNLLRKHRQRAAARASDRADDDAV